MSIVYFIVLFKYIILNILINSIFVNFIFYIIFNNLQLN